MFPVLSSHEPVHPHTRGDIVISYFIPRSPYGSPPHAWGHRDLPLPPPDIARFTPTRVGTSCALRSRDLFSTVHPHTRGDIYLRVHGPTILYGSPPHAWGHPSSLGIMRSSSRFTPTRVGTSRRRRWIQVPTTVHPHTRGDIIKHKGQISGIPGSPPHAWGHRCADCHRNPRIRFTPTRVGTSAEQRHWGCSHWVHPHTRGDIQDDITQPGRKLGSPPHAWGHRNPEPYHAAGIRFTPTRVGTSNSFASALEPLSVHPHTRGDILRELIPAA